jgi:hypothetical protein
MSLSLFAPFLLLFVAYFTVDPVRGQSRPNLAYEIPLYPCWWLLVATNVIAFKRGRYPQGISQANTIKNQRGR